MELRATLSLSRLWQQQGKREAAQQVLAPVYGWFTEGLDTADLQEAKAESRGDVRAQCAQMCQDGMERRLCTYQRHIGELATLTTVPS